MLNMNHYPDLSKAEPADRLLFDLGFSYALLERTKNVLKQILECDDYPVQVDELLAAIEAFQAGRLRVRSELYENAAAAADKGFEEHPLPTIAEFLRQHYAGCQGLEDFIKNRGLER
jgi:hypothetical protein